MQIEQLGPYRIGKKLGKGGMGSVYEALEDATGRRVAVKALSPQLAMAEGFRDRFESEIESLKKLQHKGIVRLFGYGEQDGILFYSMELVDGTSLEEEINAGRRFDWHETLNIGIQVCHALKHAHDHGIVHRDIKPANLLLAEGDRVKIADFGIARLFGATQLTTAGGVLGTADYMSPEQADGRPVTEKCDQYALGGVMYALLVGRPPFRAQTMPEMLQMQRFAEPEPVRRFASDTPSQLERLILQLLAKQPDDRFPNVLVLGRHMEAMAKALSRPVRPEPDQQNDTAAGPAGEEAEADCGQMHAQGNASRSVDIRPYLPPGIENMPSHIFDTPTVADVSSPAAESAQPAASTAGQPPELAMSESRFTTVAEDAASRRSKQTGSDRLMLAVQLTALVAALGAMAWGGWWLMRPATADNLYDQIMARVKEQGFDDLRGIEKPLDEFYERFSNDPRTEQLNRYREELELQRMERRLKFKAKFSGGLSLNPIEQLYGTAIATAQRDTQRGIQMLASLLALYDPSDATAGDTPKNSIVGGAKLNENDRRWLILARRQLAKLHTQAEEQTAKLLPALHERLEAAVERHKTDPATARRMFRAIVDLYTGQSWADEAVNTARRHLDTEDSNTEN